MIYIENKKTSHILQQEHMKFGSLNFKHDFLHFRCCYNDCGFIMHIKTKNTITTYLWLEASI